MWFCQRKRFLQICCTHSLRWQMLKPKPTVPVWELPSCLWLCLLSLSPDPHPAVWNPNATPKRDLRSVPSLSLRGPPQTWITIKFLLTSDISGSHAAWHHPFWNCKNRRVHCIINYWCISHKKNVILTCNFCSFFIWFYLMFYYWQLHNNFTHCVFLL